MRGGRSKLPADRYGLRNPEVLAGCPVGDAEVLVFGGGKRAPQATGEREINFAGVAFALVPFRKPPGYSV